MSLTPDYVERVYAGVLGKLIGVYLGRPFEGWSYQRILRELGEVNYYVHQKLDVPLIVTDDDISGTFTFLRALPDYDNDPNLSAAQIGQTWLNYLIQERSILWWGGLGNSTEHTAYLRLKQGIPAPESGSMARNGKVVAEQIGAQIFIDGWAMVAPGDPAKAAELARRAASVSHDGEAIYGAQVIAAMESLAFVEANIPTLLDTALGFIPPESVIARMIDDIRTWHAQELSWQDGFAKLAAHYGYDKYGGNCHMVPNHGLIIHALLHGQDDFQKSLMIVNTCGWDTDCNSGNLGCLLGIKNGLAGIEAGPDWRGPVADRLYLPTADGGRSITDAVTESYHIVNIGRALANKKPLRPKNGARFHFELPGSVQGFHLDESIDRIATQGTATLENVLGHSESGRRSLAIHYTKLAPGRKALISTPTFIPSKAVADYFSQRGYALLASPTLYSGQVLQTRVEADASNAQPVQVSLTLQVYGADDALEVRRSDSVTLAGGDQHHFRWQVPNTQGDPIAAVGLEITGQNGATGSLYLDYLRWDGPPQVQLARPAHGGSMWKQAWVNALDRVPNQGEEAYRLIQNEGRGLLIQGTRTWQDYVVQADVRPHLVDSAGIAARVQGLERYYALLLGPDNSLRLLKRLDGDTVLAERDFAWQFGQVYDLRLQVAGPKLDAFVNDQAVFSITDTASPLLNGAIALVCEAGRTATEMVRVGAV